MTSTFVSRAGHKLQHALTTFNIDVTDMICADFGCNAGGFVDCLLQNGAKQVYAIDTGYGVLDWNLRNDDRVVVMERTNALHAELPNNLDLISIDVSWTPQKHVIPRALSVLRDGGIIVSLIKPHYEAEPKWLHKGKLAEEYLEKTLEKVKRELTSANVHIIDCIKSPIVGQKGGNVEYLMFIKK